MFQNERLSIRNSIFKINSPEEFDSLCLRIFHYQASNIKIYGSWLKALGVNAQDVNNVEDIPFLPIQFFKEQEVFNSSMNVQKTFRSSGTTGRDTSSHRIAELSLYEESYVRCFENLYGKISDYTIIGLLPSYLERNDSSLVCMVQGLIEKSGKAESGFFLNNYSDLLRHLQMLEKRKEKVWLIGVSFALIDFAELQPPVWDQLTIVETGGMKGKKKEMIRMELHNTIKKYWPVSKIHSEYGMTELLSQAWMTELGEFHCPPWMSVNVREMNDPFKMCDLGARGGLNVIDLANLDSCSFIATQDLGLIKENGKFDVIGRFDNSDIRGCNLLTQ